MLPVHQYNNHSYVGDTQLCTSAEPNDAAVKDSIRCFSGLMSRLNLRILYSTFIFIFFDLAFILHHFTFIMTSYLFKSYFYCCYLHLIFHFFSIPVFLFILSL